MQRWSVNALYLAETETKPKALLTPGVIVAPNPPRQGFHWPAGSNFQSRNQEKDEATVCSC